MNDDPWSGTGRKIVFYCRECRVIKGPVELGTAIDAHCPNNHGPLRCIMFNSNVDYEVDRVRKIVEHESDATHDP